MLPDAPVFAVFLAAVVTLAVTQGPDMIYVASRALGQGPAAWATGCAAIRGSSAFRPGSPPRSWPASRSASRCPRTDNMEPRHHG